MTEDLKWRKYYPLTDQNAFICLVDSMGDDSSIVQAARVSYGNDEQKPQANPDCPDCNGTGRDLTYKGAACDCKWIPDISPKDLPLSTYTRTYWKCDLHNIFNFLRLRMDSHAQLEIRQFANCMFEIVKQLCPVACEAFEDYVLPAKKFSRMEMELLNRVIREWERDSSNTKQHLPHPSMTDREWKEFTAKLS